MPANTPHQIVNIPSGHLNDVDDVYIGGPANSLTGQAFYRGQLGAMLDLDHETALALSLTSVGTLYGGVYQYVQTKTGSTATPARGLAAYWASHDDIEDYIVTPDPPSSPYGCFAGVYIDAQTKGRYCWIQRSGLASCLFQATALTRATPAAQSMVFVTNNAATFDQEEDATNVTVALLAKHVGIAAEAPVAGAISLVELFERFVNH